MKKKLLFILLCLAGSLAASNVNAMAALSRVPLTNRAALASRAMRPALSQSRVLSSAASNKLVVPAKAQQNNDQQSKQNNNKKDYKSFMAAASAVGLSVGLATFNNQVHAEDNKVKLPYEVQKMISGSYWDWSSPDEWELFKWYERNPSHELKQAVLDYCVAHFSSIQSNILCLILDADAQAVQAFTPVAVQKFKIDHYKAHYPVILKLIENNHDCAKDLTEGAVIHFDTLGSYYRRCWTMGCSILEKIMQHNPDAAKVFTPVAVKYFKSTHPTLLSAITEKNPEAAKLFVPQAVAHFAVLSSPYEYEGRDLLKKLIAGNAQAAKAFTPLAARDFVRLDSTLIYTILDNNPDAAKDFTPVAIKNFHKIDEQMLIAILTKNPDAAKAFAPLAAKYMAAYGFSSHYELIANIIESNPDSVQEFTPLVIANFYWLNSGWRGRNLLKKLVNNSVDIANKLIPLILQNVSNFDLDLCQAIIKKIPDASKEFAAHIRKDFKTLSSSLYGSKMLIALIDTQEFAEFVPEIIKNFKTIHPDLLHACIAIKPDLKNQFTDIAIENLSWLTASHDGSAILQELIIGNKDLVSAIMPHLMETVTIANHHKTERFALVDHRLLCAIILENSDAAKQFIPLAVKHFNTINKQVIFAIVNKDPEAIKTFAPLFGSIISATLESIYLSEPITQSRHHMRSNLQAVMRTIEQLDSSKTIDGQQIAKFIKECSANEQQYSQQGYATFWHAQDSKNFFPAVLDKLLYDIKTDQPAEGFLRLFTQEDPFYKARQKQVDATGPLHYYAQLIEITKRAHQAQAAERKRLLTGVENEKCKKMLFLNDSLFGNISDYGENSFPGYFLNNSNASFKASNKIIEDVFQYHGLAKYKDEFKDELEKLHCEYVNISKYGTLYLLAVPKDKLKAAIMPVKPYGWKRTLEINGQPTDDMEKIAQALKQENCTIEPADTKEYVGIMTHDADGLLNPQSGLKVVPHMIAKDEQQYKEWQTKWQDVQRRIKERIEADREKLPVSQFTKKPTKQQVSDLLTRAQATQRWQQSQNSTQ